MESIIWFLALLFLFAFIVFSCLVVFTQMFLKFLECVTHGRLKFFDRETGEPIYSKEPRHIDL